MWGHRDGVQRGEERGAGKGVPRKGGLCRDPPPRCPWVPARARRGHRAQRATTGTSAILAASGARQLLGDAGTVSRGAPQNPGGTPNTAPAWPGRDGAPQPGGTCGLRPLASDHSSLVDDYENSDSSDVASLIKDSPGVPPGTWPGIVGVQAILANGTWHVCAGALIHAQWVLTVARCFFRSGNVSIYEVVIGATDLGDPGPKAEVRHIQKILMHQDYEAATAKNNIALVELDRPVECSDYIQLACLPHTSLPVAELKTCYMAGWRVAPHSAPGPRLVLQEAKVRLMDVQLCNSSRWYRGAVHPQDLCAGYPRGGIDTCQGDIGAPLVCKDQRDDYFWLVGLASWCRSCSGDKRPGVFTSTQRFRAWIHAQLGLVSAKPALIPSPTLVLTVIEQSPNPQSDHFTISFPTDTLLRFLKTVQEFLDFLKVKMS
ncbi:acrosin-like [Catharus ustulatus]|uniref:acrosin-like n=1 Tax=Catharus ustulatus TaxID=91951 RepID=UPI0014086628|nr:acrosin-like [Catharus ustulatus]